MRCCQTDEHEENVLYISSISVKIYWYLHLKKNSIIMEWNKNNVQMGYFNNDINVGLIY
jgi:hypothetical protein